MTVPLGCCRHCGWEGDHDRLVERFRWFGLSRKFDLLCPECGALVGCGAYSRGRRL